MGGDPFKGRRYFTGFYGDQRTAAGWGRPSHLYNRRRGDVTSGKEVASGTALQADHRYMVAEDTTAMFIVTTKTAVVQYQGGGSMAAI